MMEKERCTCGSDKSPVKRYDRKRDYCDYCCDDCWPEHAWDYQLDVWDDPNIDFSTMRRWR